MLIQQSDRQPVCQINCFAAKLSCENTIYHNNYYNNSVPPIYQHHSLKSFLDWLSTCGPHCLLCLLSALHGIEIYLILVHFIQLVLPLPLHEYKLIMNTTATSACKEKKTKKKLMLMAPTTVTSCFYTEVRLTSHFVLF